MGKNSSIEWTHHTFNPWWGCLKVSDACKHCYAETWSRRLGMKLWGPAERRFFSDAHWREPLRWNREAKSSGVRRRVFCASMADVFESRPDLVAPRARLWDVISETPDLDWLLLTKRPENVRSMNPWGKDWPANVWLGATAENQTELNLRAPHLLSVPAKVHFLSCEPLLGDLDLEQGLAPRRGRSTIDWVIVGGESGGHARQMKPLWARALRDQCVRLGIAFHFKQWGDWGPGQGNQLVRLGKKKAGRVFDGRTWDEFPAVRQRIEANEASAS